MGGHGRERGSSRSRRVAVALAAAGALVGGLASPGVARAGKADVVAARAECTAERVCSFSVTVKHADTGWRHYASRFEIVGPDGAVLGTRVLRHPHVHEQPFTRSLGGVGIPEGVDRVSVRAIDEVHGAGGETVEVTLVFPEKTPAKTPTKTPAQTPAPARTPAPAPAGESAPAP